MKVLHITNWFPDENTLEGIWIKRHIKSLSPYANQEVWHVAVKHTNTFKIVTAFDRGVNRIIIHSFVHKWFLTEILNFVLITYVLLIRSRATKFDIVNFHIAYPQLTYWRLIKGSIKTKTVITEHWSAYHFEFNVVKKNKLKRIRAIFKQNIPVIAVSQSLLGDIIRFADGSFKGFVVPNVVDTTIFYNKSIAPVNTLVFLMASQWKEPKNPFLVIQTLEELYKKGWRFELRIIGYGPQWSELNDTVSKSVIQNMVVSLGKLSSKEISVEMNKANAFIHCSEYETFSVVCAEALCCGTPVLASAVGGIKELVDNDNGILSVSNTVDSWRETFVTFLDKQFDRDLIAKKAAEKYSIDRVGSLYFSVLNRIVNEVD